VDEFRRLLQAARNAPERPALKETGEKSSRPGQRLSGPERAELYLTLVYTGLRIGELAKILVGHVQLNQRVPTLYVPATVDKKDREHDLPLRADLVEILRPRVMRRHPTDRLFDVPADLIKRFNGDCKRAGIPKRDDRGRTVDIHSLRMTYNTWLAQAGVAPRVAMQLMRHEDIEMTMNVYTDPALFDLQGAVEMLPAMHQADSTMHQTMHQTGVIRRHSQSTDVNVEGDESGEKAAS
jgi:integrase